MLEIRNTIWQASGQDADLIARCKQGIKLTEGTQPYYEALLRKVQEATKPRRTKKPRADPTTDASKARYREAKWNYECKFHPLWVEGNFSGSFFIEPDFSKLNCATANGLTRFVANYLRFKCWNVSRISVEGRVIEKDGEIIRIPSSVKTGRSDVDSTQHGTGRHIQWEIKVGRDIPSKEQLREQANERRAGGEYLFIHNAEEFFMFYDSLSVQKELFLV